MTLKEWHRMVHEKAKPAYAALMSCYPFKPEDLDDEEWRIIEGFGDYQISNYGRVKSLKWGKVKILKPNLVGGYLRVELHNNGVQKNARIHQLVATAFITRIIGKNYINHRDGHKFNNHVDNLEWVTSAENNQHAFDTGLNKSVSGEENYLAGVTNEQAKLIRENPDNLSTYDLAGKFGLSATAISRIQTGKSYLNAGGTVRQAKVKKPRVPDDVRDSIRKEFVKGDRQHGAHSLGRRYGLDPTTILNIVNE